MNVVYPVNEQVSLEDPYLVKFAHQLNRGSSPVVVKNADNPLPIGNCYWNVDAVVEKNGGSMVLGWDITIWPGSHLSAVHHAIYKNPVGELYDVTGKLPGNTNVKHSIFIPDDKISIQLDQLPLIGIQFFIINDSDFVNRYIEIYQKMNHLERKKSQLLYDSGYRCGVNKANARGKPLPQIMLPQSKIEILTQLQSEIQQLSPLLGDAMNNLKNFTATLRSTTQSPH